MVSEVFFVLLDCWIIKPFKQLTERFEAGEFMERMFKASHEFRSYSFLSQPSGCSEMLNRFTILSHRWDKAEFCDFEVTKSEQAQSVHSGAQNGKLIFQNMKSTSHFKKREVDFPHEPEIDFRFNCMNFVQLASSEFRMKNVRRKRQSPEQLQFVQSTAQNRNSSSGLQNETSMSQNQNVKSISHSDQQLPPFKKTVFLAQQDTEGRSGHFRRMDF